MSKRYHRFHRSFKHYLQFRILSIISIGLLSLNITIAQDIGLEVDDDQTVLFGDSINGPGSKAFWLPAKAAFRAGVVDQVQWDPDSIGHNSTSFGRNNTAMGEHSMAWGLSNTAEKYLATAWGDLNIVKGAWSTSWGLENSILTANATAWGQGNIITGLDGTAWGLHNTVSGSLSSAWGENNIASGSTSTALGSSNTSSGPRSVTMGFGNEARGFATTKLGVYSRQLLDEPMLLPPTVTSEDYPVLVVGNGTFDPLGEPVRSNALTVTHHGYLGIGTTDMPIVDLHLKSSGYYQPDLINTGGILLEEPGESSDNWQMIVDQDGALVFARNNIEMAKLDNNGVLFVTSVVESVGMSVKEGDSIIEKKNKSSDQELFELVKNLQKQVAHLQKEIEGLKAN